MNYPGIIEGIYHARVPQHASGNYPDNVSTSASRSPVASDPTNLSLIAAIQQLVSRLNVPIKAYVPLVDLEKAQNIDSTIKSNVTRRQ